MLAESSGPARAGRLMISTLRNEGAFILEWLAWHRMIGFTDFLIYSNDCEDGSDAMLDRLAAMGIVQHRPNPRKGEKSIQWQALTRARDEAATRAADWIMVADIDEFLVIHAGAGRLDDLFAAVPAATAFAIDWRMFGSGGQERFTPGLVSAQFTRAAPDRLVWPWRAVQFKTLFRNHGLARLGVHRPKFTAAARHCWHDGNGEAIPPPLGTVLTHARPRHGLAQINHYALGSADDFLLKTTRGRPNRTDLPIGLDYWAERNFNTVEDRRLADRAPELAAAVEGLLDDPALARLHAQAVEWRLAKIAALKAQPGPFHLYATLLGLGSTQILPMARQQELLRQLQDLIRRTRAGDDR